MQQGGGGGGGGGVGGGGGATATTTAQMQQPVESASPISSRPPASSNLEELMRLSEESDRLGGGGGGGGGVSSGNRWPRQETLALLKIRSDMDAAFRDATVKGPLWEDVSRKLAELGYSRSAKKCKEKFENVHKYYKRTKEGRAGRQDGKSYKFFSQLEALHSTTSSNMSSSLPMPVTTVTTTANAGVVTLDVAPVSIGIPMPVSSSLRIPPITSSSTLAMSSLFRPDLTTTIPSAPAAVPGSSTTPAAATTTSTPIGISFSSNSSSSLPETEEDDDDDMEFEGQPSNTAGSSRKRKRQSSSSTHRMMDFFESLMKQVMQKQEAMQQRFLEVIEKREQDRMIREEAWKRQEMARLAREHELMSQERAISASRDAAIISFLQKVTGQTIQLPSAAAAPSPQQPPPPPPAAPPQPPPPVIVAPAVPIHLSSTVSQERRDQQPPQPHQQQQQLQHQLLSPSIPSDIVMAIPEQQIPPPQEMSGGSFEPSSSRWPKAEVLALIKIRSGLEPRYQEAGPKGPLWEEISAAMHRMGYKRSAKRCKEKWENINKYFKKVKESKKKRPEDAKTCPYYHELDALYRKKILGNTSGGTSSSFSGHSRQEEGQHPPPPQQQQHQQESINLNPIPLTNIPQESSNVPAIMPPAVPQVPTQASESENKNEATHVDAQASNLVLTGSLFGEGNGGASNKPEDIVKELMNRQGMQQQQTPSIVDDFDKIEEDEDSDSDKMDREEDEEEDEEAEEVLEEERKNMAYKVEFQRQNTSATNGGTGNGAPSFLAMVQ